MRATYHEYNVWGKKVKTITKDFDSLEVRTVKVNWYTKEYHLIGTLRGEETTIMTSRSKRQVDTELILCKMTSF